MYFWVQFSLISSGALPAVPQQKLAQPLSRPLLILLGILARPHQIPQRFMRGIGNPHRRQIAGAITARQLLGIAAIGLDPIARLDRHQRGSDHFTATPSCVNCQYRT